TQPTPATSVLAEAPLRLPLMPSSFLSTSIIPHLPPKRPKSEFNYYPNLSPGPDSKARSNSSRACDLSCFYKGLPMAIRPLPEVTQWINQCFYCGQFSHQQNSSRCPDRFLPRSAEHYDDWRLIRFDTETGPKKLYSLLPLWPGARAIEAAPLVKEIPDTTGPMVNDTPITSADQPPPIPWNTHPTILGTQTRASVAADDDDVFVDAGCACTCH
ncbi:hypothetical protein DFH28DRAFT_861966, partial [Melampsora americana]